MTVIRHADLPVTPWKNGGGLTRELLVVPHADGSPAVRISMAEVDSDGPFSAYPGVHRLLTVLRGDPLHLVIDGVSRHLAHGEVLTFDGGAQTTCSLTGAPVEDLGVMTFPTPDGIPASPTTMTLHPADGLLARGVVAVVTEGPVLAEGQRLELGDAVDLREGACRLTGPGQVALVSRGASNEVWR